VLETDVHTTSDGHFILSHDPSGLRMAKVNKAIGECTLAEVKSWDIGRGFVDASGGRASADQGIRAPTLEEMLTECADALLNVDIKEAPPRVLPRLLELIERHGATERVLLSSFSGITLRRIRELGYPGPTGMGRLEVARLALLPPVAVRLLGVAGDRVQVAPRHYFKRFDTKQFIDKSHNLGLAVDFWVINRRVQASELLEIGADGIMTDDPRAIAQLFHGSARTAD
jgi:glycerophosphoryl diester phosphodiesterase